MRQLSREDLERWFNAGIEEGATHMIVVCDTFDWEDYPVYVKPTESVAHRIDDFHKAEMQKVMEVYNLKKPFEGQKTDGRFVYDV
jgi:hypothetical protein